MKKTSNTSRNRGLLDMAMDMHDDQTGLTMDDEQLRAQVFAFLFAGQESTSVTMAWTLYELAKYPDMQEKIREEANKVLSDGTYFLVFVDNVEKHKKLSRPTVVGTYTKMSLHWGAINHLDTQE